MGKRITKKDLQTRLMLVHLSTHDTGYYIEWAYGQPRLMLKSDNGHVDVSPRLSTGRLYQWMMAFVMGATVVNTHNREVRQQREDALPA